MIKVSVITAVYNNKDMIESALLSIQSQTYQNIEHIVIDGVSTDGTLEIVNNYKSKISILISEPDEGIYDALNKGISHATGDIICFLHADDFFAHKNVIAHVVEAFEKYQVNSLYGDLEYVSKDDTTNVVRYWKSGEFHYKKIAKGWMPPHPAFFVKRNVYEKYGTFDTSFAIAADYDFVLRVLGKNRISTAYLPEVLYKMRVGGVSNRSLTNISKIPQFFKGGK